ncbi:MULTISPECIES: efflux transporter outer membrane subunit [Desulfococcus]|jgi:multidrug efflux system outer membrane protein|uniref:RND efflux system, outer membrane lipoprotein, NodT family n=1 Tax=Desulfococcus multivorans DSM 2059 TaxID=1121405 RepID=S7U1Y1_DESML|nr:efflux transporter outer membrane subunit [Desulfococcus multivorans]AQV00841.1 multidrug transporter [Desulfococcus multivorans]EPR43312.1 RND efflux system, outer membrane lipoprotein, NodT family [Desulfococcus multivorans DSM 2059]MDX9818400.1 efflux transporter outer membrane subunit [Desulfococcus multivorans]SJZ42530.1 outer membrane protein, multidrug efflux system [Desulfococcus multivorans DSM 2059]
MRIKIISLGALAALLLTGCTMIPEYSRPDAPVPDQWPTGPAYDGTVSGRQAPPAADLQWRQFFTGKRLSRIIETALANNRDLRVAALNVERARAFYRIQRAELLPRIDAVGSGYAERVPADLSSTGNSRTIEEYRADIGTTAWEIDFFGRIRSLEKQAMEEYLATEYARRSAQILLIAETANAYLTLAADRENLQLARSTLEAQEESHHLIQRRFDVGLAPKIDLWQVRQRVDAARLDVARYTELTAQDENALNLLVGTPVAAHLLPEGLSSVTPPPDISPGISSEVLLRRPDILQAESLLKAANANIGAARAALFPRISLTTAVGTASDELSGLFKSGSGTWMFSPGITMPVFDPRIWSALDVSKAERELTLARYEGAIQAAFKEIADALATKGTVGHQLDAQRSLVEATSETYRLSNSRYEKGIDTYLSVLDAQRSLYAAQQGLITTRLAEASNKVRLYAVLGGSSD